MWETECSSNHGVSLGSQSFPIWTCGSWANCLTQRPWSRESDKLCPDSWPMETVSWKCALFPPAKFWSKLSYIWLERRGKNEFKHHGKEACAWFNRKQQLLLFRYLLLNGWYWLYLNTLNLFKYKRKVRNMEKFKEKIKIMHNFTTNT